MTLLWSGPCHHAMPALLRGTAGISRERTHLPTLDQGIGSGDESDDAKEHEHLGAFWLGL